MDILILIGVAIMAFMSGWNTREQVAQRQNRKFFEKLVEQAQEEQEELIRIKIEKHNGVLYAYQFEDSLFIAQATDRKELEEKLAQKYPGKRFGCSEENLKEIGFTS